LNPEILIFIINIVKHDVVVAKFHSAIPVFHPLAHEPLERQNPKKKNQEQITLGTIGHTRNGFEAHCNLQTVPSGSIPWSIAYPVRQYG